MSKSSVLVGLLLLIAIGCNRDRYDDHDSALAARASSAAAPLAMRQAPAGMGPSGVAFAGMRAPRAGFASAPDHGELAAYPQKKLVRRDGVYTWHRADISEEHALRAIFDGVLDITTPSGKQLKFQYQRHVEHPSGDWTWVGSIIDGPAGHQAILTFGAEAVFGSIGQPGGIPLRLLSRDGVAWLVETDRTLLATLENSATRPKGPDYLIPSAAQSRPPAAARDGALSTSPSGVTASAATATATTVVDLLIGYTAGFATAQGGASAAVTRLNHLVEVTNQAYIVSKVDARIRLVSTLQVNYTDTTSNDAALKALTGTDGEGNDVVVPTALQALRNARETYGADLVSLVRKFSEPENDGCGIAWLIGGDQKPIGSGHAPYGYSIVSDGSDQGSDGKNYFCRSETLAHELGHNMGSAHDIETAKGDDGVLDGEDYGRYTYSFGYKTSPVAGDFYTIMAYGDSGQTPYGVFSNPRITFCGDRSCGSSAADNARSLVQTIPIIAGFRAATVEPSVVRDDVDGDGRSDLLFRYSSTSGDKLGYWIMEGATVERTWSIGTGLGYHVGATGDFNGDGYLDIAWTSSQRDVKLWLGNGTSFSSSRYAGSYASGWALFGAGDIDGDGRSDLLFRYSSTSGNKLGYWIMEGASVERTWSTSTGSAYRVGATGDFNGDGYLDIAWTSGQRDVKLWLGNGASFSSSRYAGSYASGWSLLVPAP